MEEFDSVNRKRKIASLLETGNTIALSTNLGRSKEGNLNYSKWYRELANEKYDLEHEKTMTVFEKLKRGTKKLKNTVFDKLKRMKHGV